MKIKLPILLVLMSSQVTAQSAREHHSWQDTYPLQPLSHTATAITGPVRVTKQSIIFNGVAVPATLEGMYWRAWGFDGEKHTASVYQLRSDPGKLRQGNTLCGSDIARYVVLWEAYNDLTGPAVNMAVFSSAIRPEDGDSSGLCGTFSYVWKVR